jgi:hypothetical protein
MRVLRQALFLTFFPLLLATPHASAAGSQEVPLASVARSAHLDYAWLGAARALQLSGPGIVFVIRPGDYVYDVNDRVEVTAVLPRYVSNDIYVSKKLADHIISLARQAQVAEQQSEARLANAAAAAANQARTDVIVGEAQGAIVLQATQLNGAEALLITGQAPPTLPVMITLLATLSPEIPNVLLSRQTLTAGPDGKFQGIVPISPDYMRDTFVHVLATSLPGVTSANTELLLHEPNPDAHVPAGQIPGGIW